MARDDPIKRGTCGDDVLGGSGRVIVIDHNLIVARGTFERRVRQAAGDPEALFLSFLTDAFIVEIINCHATNNDRDDHKR